ncbi:hypothetical protein GYA27_04890 [candidate division WWE3 bacterium]|uniref:Uncharacterized protein n=1 Tax=candidate division WWE3 bacterium TaxID=2053526 RepID=A0A7X9DL74_UNCKA|nr:hypothetical protein [candidate division WWE3 bacterium]
MSNGFWKFYFGDIVEFLTAAWNFISKGIRQGTIGRSFSDAWASVVLAVAKMAGEPHTPSKTTVIVCICIAVYLLAILITRMVKQRRAGRPVSANAAVMWLSIVLAIVLFAWNALGAVIIVALGWWIVRGIILTKALIHGTGKNIFRAIVGLLICSGFGYLLLRAAYVAYLLYY